MKTLFLILLLAQPVSAVNDDYYTNSIPRSYSGGSGMADRIKINVSSREENACTGALLKKSDGRCKGGVPLSRSGGSQSQLRIAGRSAAECKAYR